MSMPIQAHVALDNHEFSQCVEPNWPCPHCRMTVRMTIDALYDGVDFSETISRSKFERLCAKLFQKTLVPVRKALDDAQMDKSEIDEVVMVGGSTRIPRIRKMVSDYFDGKKLHIDINPDEAVAYGAAVQGGILSGKGGAETKDVLLLDVAPLSIGTEVDGGLFVKVIERNTVIPASKTDEFTTVEDNQDMLSIKIFEGERAIAQDNHLLGHFTLEGIQPARRGTAKIALTYTVDQDGILTCSAVDRGSGQKSQITISNDQQRLSPARVDAIVNEAAQFSADDQARISITHKLNDLLPQLQKDRTGNPELAALTTQAKELLEGVLQMSLGDLQVKASETFNKASELQVAARALHGDDL